MEPMAEKSITPVKGGNVQTAVESGVGHHKPIEQQLNRGFSLLSLLGEIGPVAIDREAWPTND